MNIKKILVFSSLALFSTTLLSASLFAAPREKSVTIQSTKSHAKYPTLNESWYIYFNLSGKGDSYNGELKDRRDDYLSHRTDSNSVPRVGIAGELAFYFPLANKRTVIGPSINIGISSNEVKIGDDRKLGLHTTSVDMDFSLQHYFGRNVGHGFFLRGDTGVSAVNFKAEYRDFCFFSCEDSKITYRDGTTWSPSLYGDSQSYIYTAFNVLAGMGFSWRIGRETRMQLMLSHSIRPGAENNNLSTTNLALGMMF